MPLNEYEIILYSFIFVFSTKIEEKSFKRTCMYNTQDTSHSVTCIYYFKKKTVIYNRTIFYGHRYRHTPRTNPRVQYNMRSKF